MKKILFIALAIVLFAVPVFASDYWGNQTNTTTIGGSAVFAAAGSGVYGSGYAVSGNAQASSKSYGMSSRNAGFIAGGAAAAGKLDLKITTPRRY
jgi:opacity protein-like surface antigen